jgi:hypothetical protein
VSLACWVIVLETNMCIMITTSSGWAVEQHGRGAKQFSGWAEEGRAVVEVHSCWLLEEVQSNFPVGLEECAIVEVQGGWKRCKAMCWLSRKSTAVGRGATEPAHTWKKSQHLQELVMVTSIGLQQYLHLHHMWAPPTPQPVLAQQASTAFQ